MFEQDVGHPPIQMGLTALEYLRVYAAVLDSSGDIDTWPHEVEQIPDSLVWKNVEFWPGATAATGLMRLQGTAIARYAFFQNLGELQAARAVVEASPRPGREDQH